MFFIDKLCSLLIVGVFVAAGMSILSLLAFYVWSAMLWIVSVVM